MQYKRISFEFANIDLQSQEAFEIAKKGAPRPKILGSPIVYNIELKHFQLPFFTLLVQITGEDDYFLRAFLHEIGCGLESLACPRKVRRVREGPFMLDHALIEKHLQLIPIIKNIQMCNKIVKMTLKKKTDVIEIKKLNDVKTDSLLSLYNFKNELCELEEPKDCFHFTWDRNYE